MHGIRCSCGLALKGFDCKFFPFLMRCGVQWDLTNDVVYVYVFFRRVPCAVFFYYLSLMCSFYPVVLGGVFLDLFCIL